jgi:hypothetical protein
MKRRITPTKKFSKIINLLVAQQKLLQEDYETFKRNLVKNPEIGDLISGTGGIRKIRLKSATKGKRGGFRVCYFDDKRNEELFLILIYPKNEQENLTAEEKKMLRALVKTIKGN